MENTAISNSKWLVFSGKGEFQFIHVLTHNERAHYKEIYSFEMDLRSKGLYAHDLQQLHQSYLRGQRLVDKLHILGWEFDSEGLIVDKGHSILSKGRISLNSNEIDAAMSFAFRLWSENKTDTILLENVRAILLALQRAKALVDYRNANRQKICERAICFTSTHKERVASYKDVVAQKLAVSKKHKK